MRRIQKSAIEFISNECGGEVLEYALIAGIIIVAAIAVIAAIGGKSLARWTSLKCNL
jgi:pilus assembly protein Flp/PilA